MKRAKVSLRYNIQHASKSATQLDHFISKTLLENVY